jgi:hypothetical protein
MAKIIGCVADLCKPFYITLLDGEGDDGSERR